ncbi:hypothetical protein LOK49_LG06G00623 [Camellia lanceoleosa]|uniref:Uncharacterized protein n=1 Tax=Camellia lanceoleosa TaxID=1840588 RepID=A0ACC0HHH1_9ERIC|nr:hypothetical protein LOK49_LG06G00623 [Camellia lanceoleosa]
MHLQFCEASKILRRNDAKILTNFVHLGKGLLLSPEASLKADCNQLLCCRDEYHHYYTMLSMSRLTKLKKLSFNSQESY